VSVIKYSYRLSSQNALILGLMIFMVDIMSKFYVLWAFFPPENWVSFSCKARCTVRHDFRSTGSFYEGHGNIVG
jgi:hypothetical protein